MSSFRFSNSYQAPPPPLSEAQAQAQVSRERRQMIGMLITFVVVSVLVLFAGRIPTKPGVTPLAGPKAADYVAEAQALLTSYGTNADGSVHIPIDVAMDLIAQRGLPVRENPSPTP